MGKQTIIIAFWLLLVSACGWRRGDSNKSKKHPDEFYNVTGGWDWIRVPLIKPYEVRKTDPEIETNTWLVEFYNTLGPFSVKRVSVQDSIIYLLCGKVDEKDDSTLVNLRNVPTGWFVIDVRKKVEKGFASEEAFDQYVQQHQYPEPRWHGVDSLSEALGEGATLPWMPEP